ncbi:MAG: aminotransferase class I/II-fold pyridoxal phosphate-dependent enzyme [Dorea sp.]
MRTLYDRLREYGNSDYYGFHMPGHKRNSDITGAELPYEIDITEIEGFDDLHHADGILVDAQERAARVYHAEETHFLVNGSTVGILSAISGTTKKGDTILVARNCHKSVYHSIYMNELNPVYLYPEFDSEKHLNTEISVQDVKDALEANPDICAVMIVSPTYDGVVSDVQAIADVVHEKGIVLIVDEAHGAHFGFHPYFPENANVKGADIVIHSLHKTLPSLTQTAVLHMNGNLVNRDKVRKYLDMLQSSSPSYVLMASIDACIALLEEEGEHLFDSYVQMLADARERLAGLKHLQMIETEHYDPSKIVISVQNTQMKSRELYWKLLNEYHLQMEMVAGTYVIAMTSVGDTQEGMDRLVNALLQIDQEAGEKSPDAQMESVGRMIQQEVIYSTAVMEHMLDEMPEDAGVHKKMFSWEDSVGYISTEYAYLYPPGCPIIVPGERISKEAVDMLLWYKRQDFSVEGLKKEKYIEVLMNG